MKTATARVAAAIIPQYHTVSWIFNLILGWMLQQAPMSMFLHCARTYILYNVMYCMPAIFDIKQGCCYQYRRVRKIPITCSAYSVGCASSIFSIIRSSSLAAADGIADSCCTVFYNFIVDPLSAYFSETDFGNHNNSNNTGKHGNSSDDIPCSIPGRHNGRKARKKSRARPPPFRHSCVRRIRLSTRLIRMRFSELQLFATPSSPLVQIASRKGRIFYSSASLTTVECRSGSLVLLIIIFSPYH